MNYKVKRIFSGCVSLFVCWFGFLETRYLGADGSTAKAQITPCLLLIWWENNCGEENKAPSRQWERENELAVRAGQELLQL